MERNTNGSGHNTNIKVINIAMIIITGAVMIVAAAGVEQEIQTPQLQSQKPLQKETGGERRGTTGKGRSQVRNMR